MEKIKLKQKLKPKELKFHIESGIVNGDFKFHGHDFCELAFIESGQGIHTIGNRDYHLRKGDIFIIKGNEKHGFFALENVKIFNIMFNVSDLVMEDCGTLSGFWILFVHEQFSDFLSHMRLKDEDYEQMLRWCNLLQREYTERTPGYVTVCHSVLMQLIVFLSRKFQIPLKDEKNMDIRLTKTVVYMQLNFQNQITVGNLAEIAGFSSRHFTRMFTQVYGMSPIEFLNELRLNHAKMLLESGSYKVIEVAALCGFQDSNYFSRYFKEKCGYAPSEWKKTEC